ncbi:hypothetical protein HD597_007153 [Nonomuraea thailandensis]|uniref:Uncharacterized protein n=1 Tax=Nonomuraea thailandensis TaxID=1188745 RepID=A0A9X2GTH7_9ACTN|nr:hypothetical protein [Nonomuraea thailandensis]MCP2360133.1 hypothetical protein [Nonomuraea thailandensis]
MSKLPLAPNNPLRIGARLEGAGTPVRTKVSGGPGPSLIDLPRAGCRRLDLSRSSHTDSIDLEYVAQGAGLAAGVVSVQDRGGRSRLASQPAN